MRYLKNHRVLESRDPDETQTMIKDLTSPHKVVLKGDQSAYEATISAAPLHQLQIVHYGFGDVEMDVISPEEDADALLLLMFDSGSGRATHGKAHWEISPGAGIMRDIRKPLRSEQRDLGGFVIMLPKDRLRRQARALLGDEALRTELAFTKNMEFEFYNSADPDANFASLEEVHAGHTGGVFITGNGGSEVFEFNFKTEKFEALDTDFPGDVTDVDEDADGVLWGLSVGISGEDARVYRIKGSQVKTFSIANTEGDTPRNMAVDGDGTVYAAVGAKLYRKTPASNVFQRFTTSADVFLVAVGLPGDVWITNQSSVVQQYTGSRFENRPLGQSVDATDIGAGPDGSIYIVDGSSFLPKKWNATNQRFDDIDTSQQMNKVDVTDEGRPWFAITSFFSANGDILRAKD